MPALQAAFFGLFIQVGFALLTCGLVRKKNVAHLVMLTLSTYVFAFLAYYAVGFAFMFGGIAPIAKLGGVTPLSGIFGHGNAGVIGTHGFLLQSHRAKDSVAIRIAGCQGHERAVVEPRPLHRPGPTLFQQ